MADTRLALAVDNKIDTATPITQANNQQQQNALATQKILQEQYNTLDMREKSRLQSTIAGAAQLKTFLDQDDLDGAHDFLMRRKSALQSRIGMGENIDTQETDAAIEMLRTGNVDELKNNVQALMAAGQVYGVLQGGKDLPSNIQEWQYYNSLSPEDQERFLTMKRANQVVNLGGSQMVLSPGGQPTANYKVTPPPQAMPEFQAQVEKAKQDATGVIPESEKANQGKQKVSEVLADVRTNYQRLNDMKAITSTTNTLEQNIGAYLGSSTPGQLVGKMTGSEAQSVRNAINNQIPALINAIRQATGMSAKAMDSNAELQFYLQQASNPQLDIQANMQALDMLENLYGVTSGSGNSVQTPTQSNVITVVNPQTGEMFDIDEADLSAAQAEGFQVQ